jgi:CRP-like cAMP-binding protein
MRQQTIVRTNGSAAARQIAAEVFKERFGKSRDPKFFNKFSIRSFIKNRLLAAQPDEILHKLLPFLESVSLKNGEYLYQEGNCVNYLYFPETAIISEFQILEDGRTAEISLTGREGVIGMLSVFDSHRAANWTQVSIPGDAFRISCHILEREILPHQTFKMLVMNYINEYIGQISQRAVCNNCHSLEQRFCSWLLMLHDRQEGNTLALTQEKIAYLLGVHRPSLTIIAQTLRKKKIINYLRGQIHILNRPQLEKIACDCYSKIDKNLK